MLDNSLLGSICSVGSRDGLFIRHELPKSGAARLIPDDHQAASAISSSASSPARRAITRISPVALGSLYTEISIDRFF